MPCDARRLPVGRLPVAFARGGGGRPHPRDGREPTARRRDRDRSRRLGRRRRHHLPHAARRTPRRSSPTSPGAGRSGVRRARGPRRPRRRARGRAAAAEDALGGLDGVVHCASAGFAPKPLAELTRGRTWTTALGATLRGAIFVAQAAAEHLTDGGAIVFIGDLAALRGWPAFLAHSAAKGGLRPLTSGLARALAPRLRVSMVHPGHGAAGGAHHRGAAGARRGGDAAAACGQARRM